ncbi:hypothetical protein [Phytoactinopolyspora endophytica]|nr:hypothetical protein [Phytoactinopolyspora endophytica]
MADYLLAGDAGTLRARAPLSDIASRFTSADDYFLNVLERSIDE